MEALSLRPLRVALPVAVIVLLIGLISPTGRASSQEGCTDPGYATDHILVKMTEDAPAESLDMMKNLNGEGNEREFVPNTWIVDLPDGRTVPEAVALYEASPDVEYAEPDFVVTPDWTSQDCQETGASVWVTDLTDTPDPVTVGQELTYEATVRNYGPEDAINVELSSAMPVGVDFVSATFVNGGARGSCSPGADRVIRCALGDLGVNAEATFTVVVRPTRADNALGYVVYQRAKNALIAPEESEHTVVLAPPDPRGCTIRGTAGPDLFIGTGGRDVICAGDGDDTVRGEGGSDIVYGGRGWDLLVGGEGGDQLRGGRGPDTLRARDGVGGNDVALGGLGRDAISADPGDRVTD